MPYWESLTEQGGNWANGQELESADAELADVELADEELADEEVAGNFLDMTGHSRLGVAGMEQTEGRQSYPWPAMIWSMIVDSSCQTDSSLHNQYMEIAAARFLLATSH